jgi:hypothetical protein
MILDPNDISGVTAHGWGRNVARHWSHSSVKIAWPQQIAVGMKKRWPEITGYSRAHDPGSNRTLLWFGRRLSGLPQACRWGNQIEIVDALLIKYNERNRPVRFCPRVTILNN